MILGSWKTYWNSKSIVIVIVMDIPNAMTMDALTTTHGLACQWFEVLIKKVYVFNQGIELVKETLHI